MIENYSGDPEDCDGCYLIVLSEYDRNLKQENDERKEQIDTHRPSLRRVEQNINPLPNIATILLD